jgi:plastocyanin
MTTRLTAPRRRATIALAVLAVAGAAVVSASRSDAASAAVDMRDFAFQPAELTVALGDTVTWTNRDAEAHAVQGGPMSSPDVPPGGTFSHTFNQVGDVSYVCRIHTYMTGVVHVTSGGSPPSSTTTAAPTTTTTTAAPTTTTTAAPDGSTTTTTAPTPSTTTTTAAPSGGQPFQDVPDDPSATYPPGHPRANDPPNDPEEPRSSTTTTASVPREFQDVPYQLASAALATTDAGTPLGDGTVLAPYETDRDGVKVFHLTMDETTVEVSPGLVKDAYAFNGVVPGPVLRVNEGDRLRLVVDNQLPFATAVHWHGMILPNSQDGVPGVTQPAIDPGDTYTYEWTAVATGTHWYHSHSSGRHIGKGLYGALEVVPKLGDIDADRDYRVMLGDTDLGFVLNGRSFPSTATLAARVGERVRLRVVNTGDQVHAMHLHGTPFEVVAQDGIAKANPEGMDTLTISPGQTFDLLATMPSTGRWLLHCHIFAHSHESTDDMHAGHTGMNGMVMILNVTEGSRDALPLPLDAVPLSANDSPATGVAVVALCAALLVAMGTPLRRRRPLVTSMPPFTKEPR